MIFIDFFVFIIVLIFIIVMLSQIFVPLSRGSSLFPFFIREHKLEATLVKERQKKVEDDICKEIEKTKGEK